MSSAEPSASTTDARVDARTAVACGIVALMVGAAYLNALHNPFVYDDYHVVVDNPSIRSLGDMRAVLLHDRTRPLTSLSYALDYALWGGAALGYHLTSLLLHALNAALLCLFARQIAAERHDGGRPLTANPSAVAVAFVAAAWFAVHPMMTESVSYVSGRSDVLSGTFVLLALLVGRRWLRGGGPIAGTLTVLSWLAAMGAKETGAMFPFVFALYDWLALDATGRRRRVGRIHAPLIALTVALVAARLGVLMTVEYPAEARVHWSYIWIALDVIRRYTMLLLVPTGQSIFHAVDGVAAAPIRGVLALAFVVLVAGLAWRIRRTDWLCSFGLGWFLLLLVPGAALTVLDRGEPMVEHRVYLASCGLFLAIGAVTGRATAWIDRLIPRWSTLVTRSALALVLISYLGLTITRNQIWASPVSLWSEAVDLAPAHFRPRLLLGEALEDHGRRDEAAEEYRTAITLQPADPTGYVKLGQLLARQGTIAEAREYFNRALAVAPNYAPAHQSLAILDQITREGGGRNR